MEIAQGISRRIIFALFAVSCLWGFALQASAESLSYSIDTMHSLPLNSRDKAKIQGYSKVLLAESLKESGITLMATESDSRPTSTSHIRLGILRTPENEQDFYWISPLIALECSESGVVCTPNAGSQAIKVGVTYIALEKRNANSLLAEKLSETISDFKTSEAFAELANPLVTSLSTRYPNALLTYGTISLPGELHANTSNLWVIADLVPLFSELGERGELKGIVADFVRDILEQMEMPPAILSAPWKRIAKEAMSKSNVMVFSVVRTQERDNVFHWVTPVSRNLHGLYGLNKPYFASLNDVPKTYRIGTLLEDYRYNVAIDNGFEVRGFGSWQELVEALLSDEIDVVFGSQGAVDLGCTAKKDTCNKIKLVSEYEVTTAYVALSRKNTCILVLEKLKLAAARVRKSNTFNEQLSSWSHMVSSDYGIAHHTKNGVIHLWNKN